MPDCPECGSRLGKIHRRTVDRIRSILVPVNRFKCQNRDCEWVGNIKQRSSKAQKRWGWIWWVLASLLAIYIGKLIAR